MNEFERGVMDEGQMLDIASELEGHGDNACPALFGGMQVCVQAADGHYLRADCKYPQDAAGLWGTAPPFWAFVVCSGEDRFRPGVARDQF